MNILQFIESGGPGGAEQIVLRLACGLSARGHKVTVVTLRTGWLTEQLREAGISHVHLESGRACDFTLPFRLARLVQQSRADVLHSHLLDSNFYAAMAARVAGVPHLATEHGDIHHPNRKRFLRLKVKLPSYLGSHFSAVSQFSKDTLIAMGVPTARVKQIYNPISLPRTLPNAEREGIRTDFGVGADEWVWIHLANLRPVKDQETLLRGFHQAVVQARELNLSPHYLWIVGDGAQRDKLETLVRELGIVDQLRFLGFRRDVSLLLQASDGFVLSSLSEAMPVSLLEAMASGLPVISTRVGGVPEVVKPEETGLLIAPRQPSELASAMLKLLSNRELRVALGASAKQLVAELFRPERILAEFEQHYSSLLQSRQ